LSGRLEAAIPAELPGRWKGSQRFTVAPYRTVRLVWAGSYPRREERHFSFPVTLQLDRFPKSMREEVSWEVGNPLRIRPALHAGTSLLEVENPSGEPFEGVLAWNV